MKKHFVRILALGLCLIPGFFSGYSRQIYAENPAAGQNLTAGEIMKKYDENSVYKTARITARIEVSDRFGTTVNEIESFSRENGDTLIIITSGPDEGQKILRLENSIYLYYPDAEEIIRLQGSALKDSVMGSDFTYEDLTGDNSILNNYNGELVGIEKIDGADCYHLILTAKTRKQLYQKQEIFIDTKTFAERKIVVYSASGKALSENILSEIEKIGTHYIPMKATMQNLLKKSSTTKMEIKEIEIDLPIPESKFSREELSW